MKKRTKKSQVIRLTKLLMDRGYGFSKAHSIAWQKATISNCPIQLVIEFENNISMSLN